MKKFIAKGIIALAVLSNPLAAFSYEKLECTVADKGLESMSWTGSSELKETHYNKVEAGLVYVTTDKKFKAGAACSVSPEGETLIEVAIEDLASGIRAVSSGKGYAAVSMSAADKTGTEIVCQIKIRD